MTFLNKILASLVGVLGLIAVFLGLRAKEKQAETNLARVKEHMASANAATAQSVAQAITDADNKGEAERATVDAEVASGKRDYFEN